MTPDAGTPSGPAPPGDALMCPSWTCEEGAVVIGVLGPRQRLGFVRPALPVDARVKQIMEEHGDPLRRIRFANRCITTGCAHWTEDRCSLIDRLLDTPVAATANPDADLPRCAIRATCRWHAQDGRAACVVCPIVVYKPGGPDRGPAGTTTPL